MGILSDALDFPAHLRRVPALVRESLSLICFVLAGGILFAHRALHLGQGLLPAQILDGIPLWIWWSLVLVMLVVGVNRMDSSIKKSVAEAGPSLERAKEFLRFVGSLSPPELESLFVLVKGTEGVTSAPASMAIDATGTLTALTNKSSKLVSTDGHRQIWIVEPYRSFASEWAKGRPT